jgi:Mannosylglycerate hydrolase MGH1-like glycoside hydrolase domain
MEGGVVDPERARRAWDLCAAVLESNWRTGERGGVPYAYTSPSPTRYPWQWGWDEYFSAFAWHHLDPSKAKAGLGSQLAAADADGFIGHTIFWGRPVSFLRSFFYNITSRDAGMTSTIQPPGLAWAWGHSVGDPRLEPGVVAYHDWIARHRDLKGDGLIWIIQPDESGLDSSPEFDHIWGRRAHGRPGFRRLVVANRKLGFDARRIAAAGLPVVCEPVTNTLHGLSQLALGRPSITPALIERCWNPELGIFVPDTEPKSTGTPAVTIAGLTPLALPDLPDEIGHEMVRRHILNKKEFWLEPDGVSLPSVSVSDPAFTLKEHERGLRRYARGPTWVNTTWLVWMGLRRLGYEKEAGQIVAKLVDVVLSEGVREHYNSFNRRGMGAKDFGWTAALLIDMLADSPQARLSYVRGYGDAPSLTV